MIWGAVIVGILVFVALFAPVLAPYDPFKLGIPYINLVRNILLEPTMLGRIF